jgi:hypothetical protein
MQEASQVEGIDDEIALLRIRLRELALPDIQPAEEVAQGRRHEGA